MLYVVSLFVWNLIEITFQNYVGWLAAGHYWSNSYCHESLFGQCTIYSQGINERLSAAYFYFTYFTRPHSIMAIGPLRNWYVVLDFMMVTMTASMIVYIFVVENWSHKVAFFIISLFSPRHLVLLLIGEFLRELFTIVYGIFHAGPPRQIRRDNQRPNNQALGNQVVPGQNPYLTTAGSNSNRLNSALNQSNSEEQLNQQDSSGFSIKENQAALAKIYPEIFFVDNIRDKSIDYIPENFFDREFSYEVQHYQVASVRYNALLGNYRIILKRAFELQESLSRTSNLLKERESQHAVLNQQLNVFQELHKGTSAFNSDLVNTRVVQNLDEFKPQSQGVLSQIVGLFSRNKPNDAQLIQDESQIMRKDQKEDQKVQKIVNLEHLEKEVQVNSSSLIHNHKQGGDNLLILDSSDPDRRALLGVSQTSSEEINERLNKLELSVHEDAEENKQFEGGDTFYSVPLGPDKSAVPASEEEIDDLVENTHQIPHHAQSLEVNTPQMAFGDPLSEAQFYDQYQQMLTSGFKQ